MTRIECRTLCPFNIVCGIVMAFLSLATCAAATIAVQIDPGEPANSGFTDPTPVAAVGDNHATTLGAHNAFFVFQTAANRGERCSTLPSRLSSLPR